MSVKIRLKTPLFSRNILEVRIKVIPLHPLSRTIAISQTNSVKLASTMSWRAIELKQRNLKQIENKKRKKKAKKKEFFEKIT